MRQEKCFCSEAFFKRGKNDDKRFLEASFSRCSRPGGAARLIETRAIYVDTSSRSVNKLERPLKHGCQISEAIA